MLQVGAGDEHLGLAVLQLELAQLAALGCAAPLRAEALGGPGDLAAAGGEGVQQAARYAGYLEVAAVFAGAPLDRIAPLLELVRERGAVVGAKLAGGAEDRPGGDSDDLPVIADGARDDHVAVELRVGRVCLEDAAGGGVPVLGGHDVPRGLLEHLPVGAPAHGRHGVGQVRDRLADRCGVCGFDLAALGLVGERPHSGHRLGGAEGQVDPAAPSAVGAGLAQPPS